MISLVKQRENIQYNVVEYIAETIEDITSLPTDVAPGSTCFVVEGSKCFMLSPNKIWKEI